MLSLFVLCAATATAQDITTIKKAKAFVMHGSIGGSANYYNSNESISSRPPWAWNLYGNFNASVYGITLPFSFRVNQYGSSFKQPFSQFGISPYYKWVKLHLGYRTLSMSPLVFEGQSFRGVGIELTPKLLRFAAFYGKLNRKVNEDTSRGQFAVPQFSRNAYGIKLGIGNKQNYFDLIYFHAKDDSNSINVISKNKFYSQENTVIGTSLQLRAIKSLLLKGDFALSGLTEDTGSPLTDSLNTGFSDKLLSKLMKYRTSTSANWGLQTSIQYQHKLYNTTLAYRRVQPGFKSLGTPYLVDDIELINWMNNLLLMKNKLNLNLSLSNQHNNLKKNLNSQMNTSVATFNVNATASTKLNINASYSGYILNQKDGLIKLNDSVRLKQQIHQFNFIPSYTFYNSKRSHSFTPVFTYMKLNDDNPVSSPFASSSNISASLSYNLGFIKKGIGVNTTVLLNQYKQDLLRYTTYGANIGGSAGFLKGKPLNIQLSTGYLINKSTLGDVQGNLTFSGNISFRKKHHGLSLYGNYVYTPYNPINDAVATALSQTVASRNFMGSISYQYSF